MLQFVLKENGVEIGTIDISDLDIKICEHFVPSIKTWIMEGGPYQWVLNKPEARRIALVKESIPILSAAGVPVPEDDYAICEARFALPGYKTNVQLAIESRELLVRNNTAALEQQEAKEILRQQQEQANLQAAIDAAVAAALANQGGNP